MQGVIHITIIYYDTRIHDGKSRHWVIEHNLLRVAIPWECALWFSSSREPRLNRRLIQVGSEPAGRQADRQVDRETVR